MVAEAPGGASPISWISFSTSWPRLGPHHQAGKWGGWWWQLPLSSRNHSSIIKEPEGREMEMVSSMASAMLREIKVRAAKLKLNLLSLSDKILQVITCWMLWIFFYFQNKICCWSFLKICICSLYNDRFHTQNLAANCVESTFKFCM